MRRSSHNLRFLTFVRQQYYRVPSETGGERMKTPWAWQDDTKSLAERIGSFGIYKIVWLVFGAMGLSIGVAMAVALGLAGCAAATSDRSLTRSQVCSQRAAAEQGWRYDPALNRVTGGDYLWRARQSRV